MGGEFVKRTLCALLCTVLVVGPCVSYAKPGEYQYVSSDEKVFVENVLDADMSKRNYNTSVFEREHIYLIEENFIEGNDGLLGSDSRPSGWDVDRRGGLLRSDGKNVYLMDGDTENIVSIEKSVLSHTNGDIVLETSMYMRTARADGFYYELSGNGNVALHLETSGRNICYRDTAGKLVPIAEYKAEEWTPIKAVLHMDKKTIDLYVNCKLKIGLRFAEDAGCIDKFKASTSKENEMIVSPGYVHLYLNFIVNERFLGTKEGKTPYDWKLNDDAIRDTGVATMQSQRGNLNSYRLSTSSILERPRLTKTFESKQDRVAVEFFTLLPNATDSVKYAMKSGDTDLLSIGTKNGGFVLNSTDTIYEKYVENLWNRFKIVFDYVNKKADVYLNYNLIAENVPVSGRVSKLEFSTGAKKGSCMWIDDVLVYEDIDKQEGYPQKPRIVSPKNGMDVGMIMYSMWREGYHFGWDRLSPYDERTPYMGYYTEGNPETADWETKWLGEHGVNFQIYPFCGVEREENTPIKRVTRGQALLDGFLCARYPMDFCIMWSNPTEKTIRGLEDFADNILPYWEENFFRNKNYKTVDNKLLVYTYNTKKIIQYLGGEENFRIALKMISDSAKKLGFNGAMILASESLTAEECQAYGLYQYYYSWSDSADNGTVVINKTKSLMEEGGFRGFTPSICQGFNTTPWRVGTVGFMTPQESNEMLKFVSDNVDKWVEMGNTAAKLVTLTCWNEWGEGHFYSPSKLYGFEYMNAVRDKLTDFGVLNDEELPSEKSFVRMNVMYPLGREFLKIMPDQISNEDGDDLVLLEEIDFSKPEDYARITEVVGIDNLRVENGYLTGTAIAKDPQIVVSKLSVDAAKTKIVKMLGWQEKAGSCRLYYKTTVDMQMGVNNKRFSGTSTGAMEEVSMLPADKKPLKGYITDVRIDPDDNLFADFKVGKIKIYGTNERETFLKIDGEEYENNTSIRWKDNVSFMSVFKYFYATLKTNILWDKSEGCLHLDYDKYSIDMHAGDKDYTINGEKKQFKNAPFFSDGNFFVPIGEFFPVIGYKVIWNELDYTYELQSRPYQNAIKVVDTDGTYNFNTDGWLDGWVVNNSAQKYIVKDGVLKVSLRSNPVVMNLNDIKLNSNDYNYAVIRLKNNSTANKGRFYFQTDEISKFSSDVGFYFDLSQNDKNYHEYIIKLSDNPNYKGNIKALRFDLTGEDGSVYIDYIKLIKNNF